MDELLKTYAQQRRDKAGAPMEMHPATRRLLQAEAAKLRPKSPGRPQSWLDSLALLWPRLGLAAAMVMVLGVTAWVLWNPTGDGGQPLRFAKQDAAATSAPEASSPIDRPRENEAAERLAVTAKAESLVRFQEANGPQATARPEGNADTKSLAEWRTIPERGVTNTVLNLSRLESARNKSLTPTQNDFRYTAPVTPVPAPALSVVAAEASRDLTKSIVPTPPAQPAPGTVETGLQLGFAAAESKDNARLADSGGALQLAGKEVRLADEIDRQSPASPARGVFARNNASDAQVQAATQARGRFAQVQSPATVAAAKKTAAPPSPVLANFVVEQTGERLRVVDADNSVYEGQLIAEAATAFADLEASVGQTGRRDPIKPARAQPMAPAEQLPLARAASGSTPQAWNFRVSGTNRTLRQPVTLEGVLFEDAMTNQARPSAPAQGDAAQVQSQPTAQQVRAVRQFQDNAASANLLNVRRIQGRMRVGATNQAPFDAVRSGN